MCGRRWGKSGASVIAAVRGHGPRADYHRGVLSGAKVYWVAPVYAQTEEPWMHFKEMLSPVATRISEKKRDISVLGGGRLGVRSADRPDRLRSVGLDGLILDEAAFMRPSVWRNVLRPALSDRLGWAIMPTTPNGRNWLYEEFEAGRDAPDTECWKRPTVENPLVHQQEVDAARRSLGATEFAQEYEAEFVQAGGAEWSDHCFERVWEGQWPGAFEASAMAIDPSKGKVIKGKGKGKGDYAAIVFVGLSGGRLWVDATIDRMSAPTIAATALAMATELRPNVVGMESNANQDLAFGSLCEQASVTTGLPPMPMAYYPQTENKRRRIFRLGPHMNGQHFRFRPGSAGCGELELQLRGFPLTSFHDDGPDALEQAVGLLKGLYAAGQSGGTDADTLPVD